MPCDVLPIEPDARLWLIARTRHARIPGLFASTFAEVWDAIPLDHRVALLRLWGPRGPTITLTDHWPGRRTWTQLGACSPTGRTLWYAASPMADMRPFRVLWRVIAAHELGHALERAVHGPPPSASCGANAIRAQAEEERRVIDRVERDWWFRYPASAVEVGPAPPADAQPIENLLPDPPIDIAGASPAEMAALDALARARHPIIARWIDRHPLEVAKWQREFRTHTQRAGTPDGLAAPRRNTGNVT